MSGSSHSVRRLPVHLPDEKIVIFRDGNVEDAVDRAAHKPSPLEAYFKLNEVDPAARQFLYADIGMKYKWDKAKRAWKPQSYRPSHTQLTRIMGVPARYSELFHLRLLLLHVRGATSYEDLRTVEVNGEPVRCPTFREACFRLGLSEDERVWSDTLEEALGANMPRVVRELFAYMLMYCDLKDPMALWDTFGDRMAEDFRRRKFSKEEANNAALSHVERILTANVHNSLSDLGFSSDYTDGLHKVVGAELAEDREALKTEAQRRAQDFNQDQRRYYRQLIKEILEYKRWKENNKDKSPAEMPKAKCRLFYLDGPGGTGKSFLLNTVSIACRADDRVVLMAAWTGVAANLLQHGRTCHYTFRLPLNIDETTTCRLDPDQRDHLTQAEVIIIDEVSMMNRQAFDAIDRLLRDVADQPQVPFGGKIVIFSGDFRQTLPIVQGNDKSKILENCVTASDSWKFVKHMPLTINMRANSDLDFSNFILSIGEGTAALKENAPYKGRVEIPDELVCKGDLIDEIFEPGLSTEEMCKRVILTPTNERCAAINETILGRVPGDAVTFTSIDKAESKDSADDVSDQYTPEFMSKLDPSGLPPHKLNLKVGCVVMLLRNMDNAGGLSNGTRLIVRNIRHNYIDCDTISEVPKRVFIPRILLRSSDTRLSFTLARRQFPVKLAYSMTVNKAQGQTLPKVGIFLQKPVFSHGQLYVALSRVTDKSNLHIKVCPQGRSQTVQGSLRDGRTFTENVVYPEVIRTKITEYRDGRIQLRR